MYYIGYMTTFVYFGAYVEKASIQWELNVILTQNIGFEEVNRIIEHKRFVSTKHIPIQLIVSSYAIINDL